MNLQLISNRKESDKSKQEKGPGLDQAPNFLEKIENRYRNRDEIIRNLQKLLENIR